MRTDDIRTLAKKYFRTKAFTEGEIELIEESTEKLSLDSVEGIFRDIVARGEKVSLPNIRAKAAALFAGMRANKTQSPPGECPWCCGIGLSECTERKTGKDFVIRCACPTGEKRVDPLPQWRSDLERDFKLNEMKGDRLKKWKPPVTGGPFTLDTSIKDLVELWNFNIKLAEDFWNDYDEKGKA